MTAVSRQNAPIARMRRSAASAIAPPTPASTTATSPDCCQVSETVCTVDNLCPARRVAVRENAPRSAGRALPAAVRAAVLLRIDQGDVDVVPRVGPHLRIGVPQLPEGAALLVVAADQPAHPRVGEDVDHPAPPLAAGAALATRVVEILDAGEHPHQQLAAVVGGLHPVADVVALAPGQQDVVLGLVQRVPQHRRVLGLPPRHHRQRLALMVLAAHAPDRRQRAGALDDGALIEPATRTADDSRAAQWRSPPPKRSPPTRWIPHPALGARWK